VRRSSCFAFSLAIISLLSGEPAASQEPDGASAFARCASCHALEPETRRPGPHLHDIVGRIAGAVEGFRYSPALGRAAEEGLVWDEAALDAFLADPAGFLPGTTMRTRVANAEDRGAIIAYLRSVGGE
jgi:cytochrome c2